MRIFLTAALAIVLLAATVVLGPVESASWNRQAADPPLVKTIVYVSDFELHAVPGHQPGSRTNRAPSGTSPGTAPGNSPSSDGAAHNVDPRVWEDEDSPESRAVKLVDFISSSLVEAVRNSGYTVRRLPRGAARPEKGVMLRGVFAESDAQNHVRRAVLGSGAPEPDFLVFVGVANLARPEQDLYQLAPPGFPGEGPPDSRYGPVITITSYAPVERFVLPKEPVQSEIKKMAQQIAEDLKTFLNKNPLAVAP